MTVAILSWYSPLKRGPTFKNLIQLSETLDVVLNKLQQQIADGEAILTRPTKTWAELEELRAERTIWTEYTAEVLETLFDSREYREGFDIAATAYSRSSGTVDDFAFDEQNGILKGMTFLRSLHKRLPLIARKGFKITQPVRAAKRIVRDPEAEATIGLLGNVDAELANSYKQVLRDLQDATRLSYRGTANELRETLRAVLFRLAPDEEVTSQPWFTHVKNEDGKELGPTHQQRARYILEKKGAGSRVHDVAEGSLGIVDEGLSRLVRDMYSRTSVASHTSQELNEIKKLVRYFDAVIHDLCG